MSILVFSGCTLENKVVDDPDGDRPSNAWRDAPSARSLSLWADPGENLLSTLAEVEAEDGSSVLPANNRVLGTVLGEAGAYFSAITSYQPFGDAFARQSMQCANSDLPDAVEELCARIQDDPDDPKDQDGEQIVFVNDLFHAPFERSLMRKILGCAQEAGFTYLAVEALGEEDTALEARGYVSRTASGRYAREPQLARLLEDGMSLGYHIVSYDVAEHCDTCGYIDEITAHAEAQATNLVAKTIGIDPTAKVLVLAGPRQAYKEIWGPNAPYTKSLAKHVWEQTELEPFTVDQVAINLPSMPFGASSPTPPSGMYMAGGPLNGQCMGSYTPGSPTGRSTLNAIIVHVPPRSDDRRWDWLHAPAEERRSITASCASCAPDERLLVQAFPAGVDIADRVPVDQTLCAAGTECDLALPAAAYQVVVWSEEARVGALDVDLTTATTANVEL